jgi:hypothetical protein
MKMKYLGTVLITSLFLASLAELTACSPKDTVDMIEQVKAYERAHNGYDVDATMALFAENAVFELVGEDTLPNLEAIRAMHEYDKGIQAQITFENCLADGLTVTCQVKEQNQWLSAAGLGEIFYPSSRFTFDEAGQIEKIVTTISAEDGAAMGSVLAAFIPWLMQERPEQSKSLFMPEGTFIYNETNGVLVIDLLAQWQSERGG